MQRSARGLSESPLLYAEAIMVCYKEGQNRQIFKLTNKHIHKLTYYYYYR